MKRPHGHHKTEEPEAQNRKGEGGQLEPTEGEVEIPLRFDVGGCDQRIGLSLQTHREDDSQDRHQKHQGHARWPSQ